MRKTNVFGRKVNQARALYLIIFVFVLVIGGYYLIEEVQTKNLEELQAQQVDLQYQIDDLLMSTQTDTYHDISQIIQYLPNSYNQLSIINEISFVRNLSGLALATNFELNFDESADSPFEESLPSSVNFVRIDLSMTVTDPLLVLDFIDQLLDQDLIYYIDALNVNYTTAGAIIQMTIYTFYNDVNIA